MATNLAAIIAGSRRNYGVNKYNPDPEARRLALQRALMAQQYQTAMSAPAGPYSGTKKALAGFQLGRQNRAEQRRNALQEAARRAYMSQMLAGGPAAASGGAPGGAPGGASALMPNEGITAGLDNLGMDMAGQRYFPPNVRDREEAITRDFVLGLTDDEKYNARGGNVPGDFSLGATDSAQGPPLEDAPTVAEAAGEASYDIPAQGMMEWADIEGTSLSGAPLDDTVVTEETEVSGPGGLTIRETGAAEVEDDDDRHLLSQFGDWLLGGRELTPELAAKRVAEMSPAELQKAAGFGAAQVEMIKAIQGGKIQDALALSAMIDPSQAIKTLQAIEVAKIKTAAKGTKPLSTIGKARSDHSRGLITDDEFQQVVGVNKREERNFQRANTLRDEYNAITKDFRDSTAAYKRVIASAREPSAAGDLSLIFNYMKVLDPRSVVRESEFAQAAMAGAYPERIKAAVQRVATGQRLSPAMRADFVKRSRKLYVEAETGYKKTRAEYEKMAKYFKLDPNSIFPTFGTKTGRSITIEPGHIEDGYKFLGGDPADAKRWKKVS